MIYVRLKIRKKNEEGEKKKVNNNCKMHEVSVISLNSFGRVEPGVWYKMMDRACE